MMKIVVGGGAKFTNVGKDLMEIWEEFIVFVKLIS
jgi:hypothetical protein